MIQWAATLYIGRPCLPNANTSASTISGRNLTRDQKTYSKIIKEFRVAVECLFGEIKTFVAFKTQLKFVLSSIGKIYLNCGLLQASRTCLYGNKDSEHLEMDPMTSNDISIRQT